MVVATALPNATNVKMVPWIRSSHRRNTAIPELDCEVVKMLAFMITVAPIVSAVAGHVNTTRLRSCGI